MELSDRPLLTQRRASGKVPTKNIQTRLSEPIAEKLELMAFTERRSQQDIVSDAIIRALTEWEAQRDRT
jgi:hypothetical protein